MIDYIPTDWYWLADNGRLFSSASSALVSAKDKRFSAWKAAGGTPTKWPVDDDGKQTDASLGAVLSPYGLTVATSPESIKAIAVNRCRSAVSVHVEAAAKARGYDSAVSCASYAFSTNKVWAAEAAAFVAWRDDVWATAVATLADVENGKGAVPSEADLIAAMPPLVWPS